MRAVREEATPVGERGEQSEEMDGSHEGACASEAVGPGEEWSVTVLAGTKSRADGLQPELNSVLC